MGLILFTETSLIVVRSILGLLFVLTSFLKISHIKYFAATIVTYKVMPKKLARLSGYLQPFGEFFIGVLLLVGFKTPLMALFALGNLTIASVFVVATLVRKMNVSDCGCYGGVIKVPVTKKKLAENIFWIILCIYLLTGSLIQP